MDLRLWGEKVVELHMSIAPGDSTIGAGTKKNILQPHRSSDGHPAEGQMARFVAPWKMAGVYTRPRDLPITAGVHDETSKQFLAETRLTIPMKRGRPARCATSTSATTHAHIHHDRLHRELADSFKVTDRHTAVDYA